MKSHLSLLLAAVLACAALPSCETFGSSKVAQGQLYVSGDGRYDPYFQAVHEEQIAAASWSDDRKAARKPIVTAVNVTPNASENTILDAIRQRAKTNAEAEKLAPAVEETKKADAERIPKLRAAAEKLEALAKEGREHADESRREYENRGADKANEEKSERMRQVRKELNAATDICADLARDARKAAHDAEAFAEDMQRALEGKGRAERHEADDRKSDVTKAGDDKKGDVKKPDDKKPDDKKGDAKKPDDKKGDVKKPDDKKGDVKKPDDKKGDAKKPDDKKGADAKPPEAPKPKPKPAEKPAEKPADKPAEKPAEKPAQKPADEVFNP